MAATFQVPLGDREVAFSLPAGMRGTRRQVAGPLLHELTAGARTACLVVTDVTRACPEDRLLSPLLTERQGPWEPLPLGG